jgi:riboflavin kinase
VKPHHIVTLKQIALMGGGDAFIPLSSRELGAALGISQQSASQRILELLGNGLIARDLAVRKQRVKITPEGRDLLRKEYADYQRIFEVRARLTLSGSVTSGLGEGAFYMRQKGYKDQFRRKLWFEPYEGTLNLRLAGGDRAKLEILGGETGIPIDAFEAEGRTFGAAKCFFAKIQDVDCAVILPVRTHHANQLEVISRHYLRGRLGLRDGDVVAVDVTL